MTSHSDFICRPGSRPSRRILSVMVTCAWAWPGGWPAHARETWTPESFRHGDSEPLVNAAAY